MLVHKQERNAQELKEAGLQTVTQNLGNEVKSWIETAEPGLVQLEWRVTWESPQMGGMVGGPKFGITWESQLVPVPACLLR